MNNEDNNSLDMTNIKTENEYYVKKLEKYEESNEKTKKDIFTQCMIATCAIFIVGLCSSNLAINPDEYIASAIMSVGGSVGLVMSLTSVAFAIAKKAGLESRINAIKEKLELYKLQNNQNINENSINYGEEKGRSL